MTPTSARPADDLSSALIEAVVRAGDPVEAVLKARFFGAVKDGYGAGDEFLGVRVPVLRRLARAARSRADLSDVETLLDSRWHEVRLLGGILLVELYRAGPPDRPAAVDLLLKKSLRLNNWDLVDTVAPHTLGPWLLAHPEQRDVLDELIASDSVWERRLALVATFALIRVGEYPDLLRLAEIVVHDRHDLIHKAAGWMLREVGARDRSVLDAFLDTHAHEMPRTMLRYALEKHSPPRRAAYLARK